MLYQKKKPKKNHNKKNPNQKSISSSQWKFQKQTLYNNSQE